MIPEHDSVVVVKAPVYGDGQVKPGDIGAVVHVYPDGVAYEVEVFDVEGNTIDVVTVQADEIRPATEADYVQRRAAIEIGQAS